jgi:hypothetical protein
MFIQRPIVPDVAPLTLYADQGRRPSVFYHINDSSKVNREACERWERRVLLQEEGIVCLPGQMGDVVSDNHEVAVTEVHSRLFSYFSTRIKAVHQALGIS